MILIILNIIQIIYNVIFPIINFINFNFNII